MKQVFKAGMGQQSGAWFTEMLLLLSNHHGCLLLPKCYRQVLKSNSLNRYIKNLDSICNVLI